MLATESVHGSSPRKQTLPSHLVLCVDASEAAVVRSVRSNHDDLWQVKLSFSIIFSPNDHRSSFRRRWHVRWFFFHYKTIFFRLSSLLSFKTEASRSKTTFHFPRKGRSVADRGRSQKLELTTSSSSTSASASAAQTIQTGISRHHDNLYALWKCLDV